MGRGLLLLLLFYTGLLPFVPLGESLLQFYLPHIFNRFVPYPDHGSSVPRQSFQQSSQKHDVQMCDCPFLCFCALKDIHPREAMAEEQAGRLSVKEVR